MVNLSSRGIFVALEGADRTGKTTQANLLVKALNKLTNKQTLLFKFPDRETPIGKHIHEYLTSEHVINSSALHLLFTANRWERQEQIRSAIASGIPVVSDRYIYSGIAYTAAKPAPTPNWDWCMEMERGLVEPDLVICLAPEHLDELIARSGYGDERYETTDYQRRVLENYVRLSKERCVFERGENFWHFVQATNKTVDEIHECIMAIVTSKLQELSYKVDITEV